MTQLHLVGSPSRQPLRGHVIFVHGLGGDPFTTWRNDAANDGFWPAWLASDIPDIAVHTLEYDASPIGWLGNTMPLVERAPNVLTELQTREISDLPIVFVCHSLGGLLVKQLLRHAMEMQNPYWQRIAKQVKSVVFLATPHRGSNLASVLSNIIGVLGALGTIPRITVSVKELEASAPALQDLNSWYVSNATKAGIETHCFYEKQTLKGVLVVNETSGRLELPGTNPIAIDADHLTICRPSSPDTLVYRRVRQIVRESLTLCHSQRNVFPPILNATSVRKLSPGLGRVFLSYRRSAETDKQLADFLYRGLQSVGHDVFIDTGMRVGTEWATEIAERIALCDYFIVLLSADAVSSEMVVGEVRRAHRRWKVNGTPCILPVRVAYTDILDYELDSYLGRLQYLAWREEADSQDLLDTLSTVVSGAQGSATSLIVDPGGERPKPSVGGHRDRPVPACDPRLLRAPGGAVRIKDPLYIMRDGDKDVAAAATREGGETLVIKAPRQMGKSSLAVRYLLACREQGKADVYLDFQSLDEGDLSTYSNFRHAIASRIMDELSLPGIDDTLGLNRNFTGFIERHVLGAVAGGVAIVFDEVDRVLGRPYQRDFFAMLRAWHGRRAIRPEPWERLDLALVISTEPYLLIDAADQSPFNVVPPTRLEALSHQQLAELNHRYGNVLDTTDLGDLHSLLGGQPYLCRMAFYCLGTGRHRTLAELEECASEPDGPFGEHLRALLLRLQERPGSLEAMQQIVRYGTSPSQDAYYRLLRAGLVQRAGKRVIPTNVLYARFFGNIR